MKMLKPAALAVIAYTAYKLVVVVRLKHFSLSEFRGQWIFLASGLLLKLDAFREELGRKVMVSPAPGSMLRWDKGEEGEHPKGRAIDVMLPEGPDLKTAYEVAKKVGFGGIGVYPDWKPYPGVHLDIRPRAEGQGPAKWAGIQEGGKQIYVSIERGFYA